MRFGHNQQYGLKRVSAAVLLGQMVNFRVVAQSDMEWASNRSMKLAATTYGSVEAIRSRGGKRDGAAFRPPLSRNSDSRGRVPWQEMQVLFPAQKRARSFLFENP